MGVSTSGVVQNRKVGGVTWPKWQEGLVILLDVLPYYLEE